MASAIAVGADFVASARGFMLVLGCLQARKCADGRCPSGVAKRPSRLFRLIPAAKAAAVERYATYVNHEVNTIARACDVGHVRELNRNHLRVMQANGRSVPFSALNPFPTTTAL